MVMLSAAAGDPQAWAPRGPRASSLPVQGRQHAPLRTIQRMHRGALAVICAAGSIIGATGPAAAQHIPAAAPAATDSPYPTIGRTRSKRYCTLETDRTNGAIVAALTNDKVIAIGIERLRAAKLDRPEITVIEREHAMHDLRAVAAAIRTNMRAADAQVADLRGLAVEEPDAGRSSELRVLADKLDAVFEGQRSVGSDLAKMLVIIDGRNARAQTASLAAPLAPKNETNLSRDGLPPLDERAAYEPLDQLFSEAADDFGDRESAVGKAEDEAAVHAPKAISGC